MTPENVERDVEQLSKIFKPYLDGIGRDANNEYELAKLAINAGYKFCTKPQVKVEWPKPATRELDNVLYERGWNDCHDAFMAKIKELGLTTARGEKE